MGSYIPGKYSMQMVRSCILSGEVRPLVLLIHLCILASKILFCILSYQTITTATSQEYTVCQQMTLGQLVYTSFENCSCWSPERSIVFKQKGNLDFQTKRQTYSSHLLGWSQEAVTCISSAGLGSWWDVEY